ncbi:hypothetical protein LOTGIDRAFT_228413 [Lottia gigantea]|uniref:Uncharacterized protein n=1 Tax=Lottia gigantea TaxID=225164 RepID=V4C853_LOTGI|nr:hypothetical protein LOTGIDRAFT_228413 [Lottia gigantea]ESO97879.1 hypothetical protein LOTGIDRAFT_228413 [Lottia gigantea]
MEPFKLTLQQVTFKEGEEDPGDNLFNSFDAVINCNYDSQPTNDKDTTVEYKNEYQNIQYTTCGLDNTTHSVGIQVPRKSGSGKSSSRDWYNYLDPLQEEGLDDFVINADTDFVSQNDNFKPSVTDISTIAQISSNSSAANKQIPLSNLKNLKRHVKTSLTTSRKYTMPSETEITSKMSSPTTPILDSSFDTVAEALHLQRTVIGNSKLTPAPPDVVAQIVAEAERKMRAESESNGSVSSLSETSSLYSLDQTMSPNKEPEIEPGIEARESPLANQENVVISQSPALNRNNSNSSTQSAQDIEVPPINSSPRELIRIPAQGLSVTKEKSGLKNQEKRTSKTKDSPESGQKYQHDRLYRKSSNERLVDKYNISDNQSFLESLSPVKSVDMTQFLPPRKLSSSSQESFSEVPKTMIAETPKKMQDTPQTSSEPTAAPKSEFVLPKLGPLFPNIPKPIFNVPRTPVPTPHKPTDDTSQALKIQLDAVLREKARLEGQLEILTTESNSNLQERAELQAQLASLKLKLLHRTTAGQDEKKLALKADLEEMRMVRQSLEDSMAEAKRNLDEKAQESKILQDELHVTQDATDKLHLKMKELRDTLSAKEMTIQALKNKIAELYVEVQNTLQSKSEADAEASISKNDLTALINAKEWYQQQLQLAHEVRCSLQKELTILQAQSVSQSSVVERLKMDNTKLRQQLTESQNKALKEKELLAKHLEAIQMDMMDREAAFREMQGEKKLIEDSFDSQCKSVEDEYSRISMLMQSNSELESQLEKAQDDAKKKQMHILTLESHQIELEKKLTLSQEKINEKDGMLEDLRRKIIEVDEQLKAFQRGLAEKDTEIMKLKEEKATAEIALNGALKEKALVDNALDALKSNMGKVEVSFKQMRHELSSKVTELESVKNEKHEFSEELDKVRKELEIKRRSYDTIHKDYDEKSSALNDIQIQKSTLESQIVYLKNELLDQSNAQCTSQMQQTDITSDNLNNIVQSSRVPLMDAEMNTIDHKVPSMESSTNTVSVQNSDGQSQTQSVKQMDAQSNTIPVRCSDADIQTIDHIVDTKDSADNTVVTEAIGIKKDKTPKETEQTGEFLNETKDRQLSQTDSSMNTVPIQQADSHSQTLEKQLTHSESNTTVVESSDSQMQTLERQTSQMASNTDLIELTEAHSQTVEKLMPQTDSSSNTDDVSVMGVRATLEHSHSQTDDIVGQPSSASSAQTTMNLTDMSELIQQNEFFAKSSQGSANMPSSDGSFQTEPIETPKSLMDSSMQTIEYLKKVSQSNKETNTEVFQNIVPSNSDSVDGINSKICDNSSESYDNLQKVSETDKNIVENNQAKIHEEPLQSSVIIDGISNEIHQKIMAENTSLKSKVVNLEDNLVFHRAEAKEVISKLSDNLLVVQTELKNRQSNYDQNVEVLGEKLRETFTVKQQLESELKSLQKKFENDNVGAEQYKSRLQFLQNELDTALNRVKELEDYIVAFQESKNNEITELQQHITTLVQNIEDLKNEKEGSTKTEELNQQLALELEKERGRLEGLIQNNVSLKQHVGQLEEALARRESSLVELQTHLQDSNKDRELTSDDYIKQVHSLETALQKEKDGQRDLRKQIGLKITENKKLKKNNEEVKKEQELLRHQVEIHEQEVVKLQTELDNNRDFGVSHQSEVKNLQLEKKSLQLELEHVQRELSDNVARNSLINEEMESLQWQINKKNREVDFAQNQVKLVEERQQSEIDLLRQTIQEKQTEIEELQRELLGAKQEKINQKSRVTELRSALKSSVQYHKLTKKLNSKKSKVKKEEEVVEQPVLPDATNGTTLGTLERSTMVEKGVQCELQDNTVIPAPEYDLDAIETLLEQTAIQTLESKPLDNLQSCLISLKSQINGLHMSMEVHTTNIHNSNQTSCDIEKEVHELQEVVRTVANTTFASLTTNTKSISTEGSQGE